jgi:predicted Fe-Mo cluster-binding NifX family protein
MKITIPIANEKLCSHFGHCEFFAVYEVDEEQKTILNRAQVPAPTHQPGVLPGWLREQGISVVIAGGMGSRAISLFESYGIKTLVGIAPNDPDQIIQDYLNNKLEMGSNLCDH